MRNAAEFYKMEQLRGMVENKSPKELLLLTFNEIISNLKKIDYAIENNNMLAAVSAASISAGEMMLRH